MFSRLCVLYVLIDWFDMCVRSHEKGVVVVVWLARSYHLTRVTLLLYDGRRVEAIVLEAKGRNVCVRARVLICVSACVYASVTSAASVRLSTCVCVSAFLCVRIVDACNGRTGSDPASIGSSP